MRFALRTAVISGMLSVFALPVLTHAQSILLVGINTENSSGDQFTFVATTAVPGNSIVYFTDKEYSDAADGFVDTQEGYLKYTTPSGGLPIGEVVRVKESTTTSNTFSIDCSSGTGTACGTVILGDGTFSVGNDGFYAFTASNDSNPTTTVTEVLSYLEWATSPIADYDPTNDYPNAGKVIFANNGSSVKWEFVYDNGSCKACKTQRIPRTDNTRAEYDNVANWTGTTSDASDLTTQVFIRPDLQAGSPLPVELVSFAGRVEAGDVVLHWQTASETDNAGFDVEQRIGGGFVSRMFVSGAGTTNEARSYETRLRVEPGLHHFRLKQIDLDGATAYSEEIEVVVDVPSGFDVTSVYPNPFSGMATFQVSIAREQHVRIEVYDLMGRLVETLHAGVLEAQRAHAYQINAQDLPSGPYIVRVLGDTFEGSRQVTLMK